MRALSDTGLRVLAAWACWPPLTRGRTDASTTASQNTQGPMTVERITSGFLAAPDFKVTRFDHRTSELAGGYAGWLTDQQLFVGGGGAYGWPTATAAASWRMADSSSAG